MILSAGARALGTVTWLVLYPLVFVVSHIPFVRGFLHRDGRDSADEEYCSNGQEKPVDGRQLLAIEDDQKSRYIRFDVSRYDKQAIELQDGSRISTMCPDGQLVGYVSDDARTILQAFRRGSRLSSGGPFLGSYDAQTHAYKWAKYGEVNMQAQRVSAGLWNAAKLFDEDAPRYIGCWSQNRAEIFVTQLATFMFNGIVVPLYDTLGQTAVEFIIRQTEMRVIVCDKVEKIEAILFAPSDAESNDKAKRDASDCLKAVRVVVLFSCERTTQFSERLQLVAAQRGIKLLHFAEVENIGQQMASSFEIREPTPEDTAFVCYTSGTTGIPKGVILTHGNLIAETAGLHFDTRRSAAHMTPNDVYISYLPMAHVYEMSLHMLLMHQGGAIGFFRGDVKLLFEDLQLVRPTIFCTVPRVLNRIYDTVNTKVRSSGAIARLLYERGLQYKYSQLEKGIVSQSSLYDKLVFKKILRLIGGRQRLICVGSAPVSAEVLTWTRSVMGCVVLEGYGQTETSACLSLTQGGDLKAGHVGAPLVCNRVKLVDASPLGYSLAQNRGELCVKGYNCTKGYLGDAAQTRELIDSDGWLHTGDIVEMLPNGTMRIIDRKKHLFKLAQGEYVAPERVELVYLRSPFVAQVFVDGNSLQTYAVAIVVPEREEVERWARASGAYGANQSLSFEELCKSPSVKHHILRDMQEHGKKAQLNSLEQVKAIQLISEPFSVENGLLTPTMKSKRTDIRRQYAATIEDIYRAQLNSAAN